MRIRCTLIASIFGCCWLCLHNIFVTSWVVQYEGGRTRRTTSLYSVEDKWKLYQEAEWPNNAEETTTTKKKNQPPMLVIQRNKLSIPEGWRLAEKEEAQCRWKELVESLDDWEICRLAYGWKIDGPGYGGVIKEMSENDDDLSCNIITPKMCNTDYWQ